MQSIIAHPRQHFAQLSHHPTLTAIQEGDALAQIARSGTLRLEQLQALSPSCSAMRDLHDCREGSSDRQPADISRYDTNTK